MKTRIDARAFCVCLCLTAVAEPALGQPEPANQTDTQGNSPPATTSQEPSKERPSERPPREAQETDAQETDAQETDAEPQAEPDADIDPYMEAKERVVRAEKLYEEGNYDAALTEFQRAYDTMLGHPARSYVLFNVGRCQERLYRYDAAIQSYRRYLEEAGPDAEDRATVAAKIELLEGLLGTVAVEVSAKKGEGPSHYQLWVDGRLIGENTRKFSIPGGNHEVEVRAEGYEPQLKEVQVAARQEKALDFELSPLAKEYKGLSPTYFYVTGGVALATGAVGAVYGVMTLNTNNEIKNKEGALVTEDDEKRIKRQALMADVFLLSAGVLATSATILAFMTDWSRNEESPHHVRVKEVGFAPLPNGGFLNLAGTF